MGCQLNERDRMRDVLPLSGYAKDTVMRQIMHKLMLENSDKNRPRHRQLLNVQLARIRNKTSTRRTNDDGQFPYQPDHFLAPFLKPSCH